MNKVSFLTFLTLLLTACTQVITPSLSGIDLGAEPATATPAPQNTPTQVAAPSPTPISTVEPTLLPVERPPAGAVGQFNKTDFDRHSVPYTEILSGGPPKDGIPPIDRPAYTSIEEADVWLNPEEPVILVEIDGHTRAYPIQILMWHEIANDALAGVPIAVTFCPLCNTAIAFERKIDDIVVTFGTSGRLRFSNLIMYDRHTESWWQQATGEAIVGEYTGRRLTTLPAAIIAWETFKESYPDGTVLSRNTGQSRPYGQNPYAGYDDVNRSPFLYTGPETPDVLLPMARVATVDLNGEAVAYPYAVMEQAQVVNDAVGGTPISVFWRPGTASALDSRVIAEGRDVGTVNTFSRDLDGRTLTFRFDRDRIVDDQTNSEWTMLGQAVAGPLAGSQLTPVVHINHFWFSWAAFRPETRIYRLEAGNTIDPTPVAPAASTAVEFDFPIDLYQGQEEFGGKEIEFSQAFASGKPVVLVMWAGLCPACRFELPSMQQAYLKYRDKVSFVGVDIGPFTGLGSPRDGIALLDELGITFPAGSTTERAIMQQYRVLGVPETLVFAPGGELVERWTGIRSEEYLTELIDALVDTDQL